MRTSLYPFVVRLRVVDDVTQQETSDVILREGRPLQHQWIQRCIVAVDVCRSADRSFGSDERKLTVLTDHIWLNYQTFMVPRGWITTFPLVKLSVCQYVVIKHVMWLTSFSEVELRSPVGALTVIDMLHVAGVLVWSPVQSEAVSLVRLQRLCVFKITKWIISDLAKLFRSMRTESTKMSEYLHTW